MIEAGEKKARCSDRTAKKASNFIWPIGAIAFGVISVCS